MRGGGNTFYPVSDVIMHCESDYLQHYGILGQKWGVRRFQNEDGSYTDEGRKRYAANTNKTQSKVIRNHGTSDKELLSRIDTDSKLLNKRAKSLCQKAKSGQILTADERKFLDKEVTSLIRNSYPIYEKGSQILDSHEIYKTNDYSVLSKLERKQLDDVLEHFKQRDQALEAIRVANFYSDEQDYKKDALVRAKDPNKADLVDPSYREFSSREEKAKAEADYLSKLWYAEDFDGERGIQLGNELGHITNRIRNLAGSAYENDPCGERTKALYDKQEYGYDKLHEMYWDSSMYVPKYENSKKYKDLEAKEKSIRNNPEYKNAIDAWYHTKNPSEKEYKRLERAYDKAMKKMDEELKPIEKAQGQMYQSFKQDIAKAALQDLGYEVTKANINVIMDIIFDD